jgi:hypothetical protein
VHLIIVKSASAGSGGPASKTVGNVRGVARGGRSDAKVTRRVDGARVVDTGSTVISLDGGVSGLVEAVGETVTSLSSSSTLADHALDLRQRARVLDSAVAVAAGSTIVVLHKTRVGDGEARGRHTDTAGGLLHDDGEDESVVNVSSKSSFVNGGADVLNFSGGVIGNIILRAAGTHGRFVGSEHVVEGHPTQSS